MYHALHNIPVVDLSSCPNWDKFEKTYGRDYASYQPPKELIDSIADALKNGDFMQLFGTGLPEFFPDAEEATKQLFSHEQQVLEKQYGHTDRFRVRGYNPPGSEKAVDAEEPDYHRQFWMTGNLAEAEQGKEADRRGDDIDIPPNDLSPDFDGHVRRIMMLALHNGRMILRCIEEIKGFEPGYLVNMTIGGDTITRSLYYDSTQRDAILAEEHYDINLMTILSGAMWGLEVKVDDKWFPVLVRPDCVLANLGEMFNQIPGCEEQGRIRHRVVARLGTSNPRIQFATFIHLLRETMLIGDRKCDDWYLERIKEIQAL